MEFFTGMYDGRNTLLCEKEPCSRLNSGKCGAVEPCDRIQDAIDKLASYEEAEKNGMLIRLPVQIGATVFVLYKNRNLRKGEVINYCVGNNTQPILVVKFEDKYGKACEGYFQFGINAFQTETEAKKELKKKLWCDNLLYDEEGEAICAAHLAESVMLVRPYSSPQERLNAKYPCSDFAPAKISDQKKGD